MIVSHKHKFIFIKTQKTAGTSIEIMLSSICGEQDIITPISPNDERQRKKLGFRGPQNYHIPILKYNFRNYLALIFKRKRAKYFNHMTARKIRTYLGQANWDSYYKFAFDRNPFDKVVSFYYSARKLESENIQDFINQGNLDWLSSFNQYTICNKVAIDKIYLYENLEESLDNISNKIGLSHKLELPKYQAKSKFRKTKNYKDILTEETKRIIEIKYAREIELLNYKY